MTRCTSPLAVLFAYHPDWAIADSHRHCSTKHAQGTAHIYTRMPSRIQHSTPLLRFHPSPAEPPPTLTVTVNV